METTLIIDLSNILYSTFFNSQKERELQYINDKNDYWRYLLLSDLLDLKKRIQPKEIIIAVDSKNTWRKEYFPYYKARRVFRKQKSPIDWDEFYKLSDKLIDELRNNFPCKFIKVDRAEADDIMAVLAINLKDHNNVVIATKDKDMKQLLTYNNIKIFDLGNKEFIVCDDPILFRTMHILKGDDGDDVPNLLSDDNVFVCDNKRQKRITQKVINEMLNVGVEQYAKNLNLLSNFERNYYLVILDLNTIPTDIQTETIYQYKINKICGNFETLMSYINNHQMYSLLEEI